VGGQAAGSASIIRDVHLSSPFSSPILKSMASDPFSAPFPPPNVFVTEGSEEREEEGSLHVLPSLLSSLSSVQISDSFSRRGLSAGFARNPSENCEVKNGVGKRVLWEDSMVCFVLFVSFVVHQEHIEPRRTRRARKKEVRQVASAVDTQQLMEMAA